MLLFTYDELFIFDRSFLEFSGKYQDQMTTLLHLLFYNCIVYYLFTQQSNLQNLGIAVFLKVHEFILFLYKCKVFEYYYDAIYLSDTTPIISMQDLKDIINDPENISQREVKVEKLKKKN